jgi:glycosyltransferase involved in cell wall biosynthesis
MLHLVRGQTGEVHVALPGDAPLRAVLEGAGIPVHPVDFRGALYGWRALRGVVERVRPDLLAAHTSHAHGHAVLAAGGRPVVVHRRVDFRPGRDPITRWKYRAATGYIAVSHAVAPILIDAGVDAGRVVVVHDGVDPGPFLAESGDPGALRAALGVPPGALLVGAVGALVPHKGHQHLVDAMAWLDNLRQDVWCLIAGEGPERGALQARIDKWGIGVRTRLVGVRDDVPSFLRALDVLCHPSVEEGMGQVLVEAMLSGAPIVASNVGGIPDVIDDMKTGMLVPPGDGSALSRALHAALRGRDNALGRAGAARDVALSRFGVPAMVHGTQAAYERWG